MKHYYKLLIALSLIFAAVITAVIYSAYRFPSGSGTDSNPVIKLNDIVYDSKEHWDDLSSLAKDKYGVDFVILDNNSNVRFDSRAGGGEPVTVEKAVKARYPYQYILTDSRVLGSVIILDDNLNPYRALRTGLIVGFAAMVFVFVAGAVIYGAYVRRNIVKPFEKMQNFAGKIAEGKLDEPLFIEQNNMFGSFTESFDIMREELNASRRREIELQKKEKELVASLSHDLKTPITGIKLTAELLKATHPDINDKLDNIYKKADEIDVLVTDLFASTLDDLGEFRVNCREESSKVIADIISRYDDKGLVRPSDIPGVIINTDTKRLSQVIGNIIYNSYKYANTPIDVSYDVSEGFLEMRIADHGPGVPENELPLITNKFYRGKSDKIKAEDGNGLGLYIASMLMAKMNGELIPSNDGGFCVTLLIPLA